MYTAHYDRGIPTVKYDHGPIKERKSKLPLIIVTILGFIALTLACYNDRSIEEINQETRGHYEAVKSISL